MGKVGKVIAGVVLTVAGVAIGVFTGQWQLAFAVSSMGVGMLMSPKAPANLTERQGAILENRTGTLERLPVIYGTARIAGAFADIRVDSKSTDRKRLVLVVAFCHGSQNGMGIQAIDELWLDDRQAVIGDSMQAPFNKNPPNIVGNRYLEYSYHLGSTGEGVDGMLALRFPEAWPSSSTGKGVCYARVELWYDTDVFPGGLPTIQAKMRGNLLYDPRLGGYAYSSNPALCIRDYLTSPIYGWGIPATNIDEQSFIDMANYCDELVSIPGGGTQKRYEINGWVDTTRDINQNLAELCTACRGQVVNEGDKWRLVIRRQRVVTGFHITEENSVEGSWQFLLPGSDTVPNVGRGAYIEPANNYDVNTVQWPEPGAVNAFLDEDNGFEQRLELDLPFTQNRLMAQQLLMTLVKESRQSLGAILTLRDEAVQCRVGDLVYVSHSTPGWVRKVFDVGALLLQPDGLVRAVLVEYDPSVYDLEAQVLQPATPATNLPNPMKAAPPTVLTLTSLGQELRTNDGRYIARIRATWMKAVDPFVDYYEVQAKKATDTAWDSFGRVPGLEDALCYIYPVTDEQWNVRVRTVNNLGAVSDWVSASVLVVTPDPRPQILSITLTNTHIDQGHSDTHSDVVHGDSGHTDTHSDVTHSDHTDHTDRAHADTGASHSDVWHTDTHDDVGSGSDPHADHWDSDPTNDPAQYPHGDWGHSDDHGDSAHLDHSDHSDTAHADSNHSDASHLDAHGDNPVGRPDLPEHEDTHYDFAHVDHTDSAQSHDDIAHSDSHTDSAHTDSVHGDGHSDISHADGQYGAGVAIQADSDSASVRAVARKISSNMVTDGGFEAGSVGAAPAGWTQNYLTIRVESSGDVHGGGKRAKISNLPASPNDGSITWGLVGKGKPLYRMEARFWYKAASAGAQWAAHVAGGNSGVYLQEWGAGYRIFSNIINGSIPTVWTEGVLTGIMPADVTPNIQFVLRGARNGSTPVDVYVDDITITYIGPIEADVRTQKAVDGRNVVIELIDAATGQQIQFAPGDVAEIGAIAYAKTGGSGAEGPLARARHGLFNVAPVGADQWVPN